MNISEAGPSMRVFLVVGLFLLVACGAAVPPPEGAGPPVTPAPLTQPTGQPPPGPLTHTEAPELPTVPPTGSPEELSRPLTSLVSAPRIDLPTPSTPSAAPTAGPTVVPATAAASIEIPPPEPTDVPISSEVPGPLPDGDPEVSLTSVREYGAWCQEAQAELSDAFSGVSEVTWGDLQRLIEETRIAYESYDPPAELQDYHEFTANGFGDLLDMVAFAYQAEDMGGTPLGIEEGTVMVEDDLLAVLVLFIFEQMGSDEESVVDPWTDLPASVQKELRESGCVTDEWLG